MTSKLRLSRDALEDMGGRLCFQGAPFDGIAFQVEGHHVRSARVIIDGQDAGPYHSEFLPTLETGLHLTEDHPELEGDPDYQPVTLDGVPLNGVRYGFENDRCVSEALHVDGWMKLEVTWTWMGRIDTYWRTGHDTMEALDWRGEGDLRSFHARRAPTVELDLSWGPPGQIRFISVAGPFFDTPPNPQPLPFDAPTTRAQLAACAFAADAALCGRLDHAFVEALTQTGALGNVEALTLLYPEISIEDLGSLVSSAHRLRALSVTTHDPAIKAAAENFQRPSLTVDLSL